MKQPTEKKEKFDSFIRGVDKRLSPTCYVDSRTLITRIPRQLELFFVNFPSDFESPGFYCNFIIY